MISEGKSYYSIGKVSTLCCVPIKTLRYYDKIGLLVPEYRKDESNYRYYTQDQILTLFIIRKLKLLGIPLKEIHEIISSRDSAAMGKCIQERLQGISQAIEDLNNQYSEGKMLLDRLNMGHNILETGHASWSTEEFRFPRYFLPADSKKTIRIRMYLWSDGWSYFKWSLSRSCGSWGQ